MPLPRPLRFEAYERFAHRDVKPENFLFHDKSPESQLKVLVGILVGLDRLDRLNWIGWDGQRRIESLVVLESLCPKQLLHRNTEKTPRFSSPQIIDFGLACHFEHNVKMHTKAMPGKPVFFFFKW